MTSLVVAGLFCVSMTLAALLVRRAFLGPEDLQRPYVWQHADLSVQMRRGGGVVYSPQTKNGIPLRIGYPAIVGDSRIAYWSQEDNALAVLQQHMKPRWYAFPSGRGCPRVLRIGLAGPFVVCDCVSPEQGSFVLTLDTGTSKWQRIPNIIQARANNENSTMIAVLAQDREVSRIDLKGGRSYVTVGKIGMAVSWDYDAASDTVFWMGSNRKVHIRSKDGRETVVCRPLIRAPESLYWQPACKELWIPVAMVYSIRGFLVCSRDGQVLGFVENGFGRCDGVYFASERVICTFRGSTLNYKKPL